MMFMSMMMVSGFLLVVGTFLLIIVPLAIGLPLLITGVLRRKKCLAAGIKPRKASIIAGGIFCGIPVAVVTFIVAMFAVGVVRLAINDMQYNNVVEYWKAGDNVMQSVIWDYCDIREEYLKAAESGNREALVALYSDNARAQPDFDKQIDEFMSAYRKGFLKILKNGGSERSNIQSYEYPINDNTVYQYDDILCLGSGGKIYGMLFLSCRSDANDAGNIGMHSVRIYSADIAADELKTGIRKPLTAASFEVNDNVSDDMTIIGNEISYTDSDSLVIDLDTALNAIKENDTIDGFTKAVGKPFAVWKDPDTSVWRINSAADYPDNDMSGYLIVIYSDDGSIKASDSYIAYENDNRVYLSSFDCYSPDSCELYQ